MHKRIGGIAERKRHHNVEILPQRKRPDRGLRQEIQRQVARRQPGGRLFLIRLQGRLPRTQPDTVGRAGEFADVNLREQAGRPRVVHMENDPQREGPGGRLTGGARRQGGDRGHLDIAHPQPGEIGDPRRAREHHVHQTPAVGEAQERRIGGPRRGRHLGTVHPHRELHLGQRRNDFGVGAGDGGIRVGGGGRIEGAADERDRGQRGQIARRGARGRRAHRRQRLGDRVDGRNRDRDGGTRAVAHPHGHEGAGPAEGKTIGRRRRDLDRGIEVAHHRRLKPIGLGAVDFLRGGRIDLDGIARPDLAADVFVDPGVGRDGGREGGEVVGQRRGVHAFERREAEKIGAVAHPRGARRQDALRDRHRRDVGRDPGAADQIGHLAGQGRERGLGVVAFDPDAPLGCAGGRHHRGGLELGGVGVRIPAPDRDHARRAGKQVVDRRVRGVPLQVDRIPAAPQRVGRGLPLRPEGRQQGAQTEKEERNFFHRTLRR